MMCDLAVEFNISNANPQSLKYVIIIFLIMCVNIVLIKF